MAFPYTLTRCVQFAETDLAGVLHFANYGRYMEEVEHAFWRSCGQSVVTQVDGQNISWPRVALALQYFEPVRFEDTVELILRVAELRDRSVIYEVEFRCQGRHVATGRMTAVCCRTEEGRFESIPIPGILRRALETGSRPETPQQSDKR